LRPRSIAHHRLRFISEICRSDIVYPVDRSSARTPFFAELVMGWRVAAQSRISDGSETSLNPFAFLFR
jgi:hypothetical protein